MKILSVLYRANKAAQNPRLLGKSGGSFCPSLTCLGGPRTPAACTSTEAKVIFLLESNYQSSGRICLIPPTPCFLGLHLRLGLTIAGSTPCDLLLPFWVLWLPASFPLVCMTSSSIFKHGTKSQLPIHIATINSYRYNGTAFLGVTKPSTDPEAFWFICWPTTPRPPQQERQVPIWEQSVKLLWILGVQPASSCTVLQQVGGRLINADEENEAVYNPKTVWD